MRKIYIPDEYKELVSKDVYEAAYKSYVNENIRNFDIRVKFSNTELTTNDIASIKIMSDLFTTDTFTIGSVVSETIDITVYNDNLYLDTSTPIIPFVSLRTEVEVQTELGVTIEEIWQEVCMGIFYISQDGVTDDGLNSTTIRASSIFNHNDYGNRVFEVSDPNSTFDRDLYNIINLILKDINHSISPNIELKNTDLPNITISDDSEIIVGNTYREIIEYIATLYGGYARVVYDKENNKNYLEFFRLPEQSGYFYDDSSYSSFKRSKDYLDIWKISCKRGENDHIWVSQSSSGTGETSSDGYHAVYIECASMTPELLSEIYTYYDNYSYHPITSKIFGSPALEVGDRIMIRGRGTQASGAEMPLHSITYNITGSGITMDIKSIYKVNPVTAKKTVKSTISDLKNEVENLKNSSSSGGTSYDDTELRSLINSKADKEHTHNYADSVSVNGNTYKQVNGVITLPDYTSGSSGSSTGDIINAKTVNIFKDTVDNVYGTLTSATALNGSYKTLDICGSQCLSLGIENVSGIYIYRDNYNRILFDVNKITYNGDLLMGGNTVYLSGGHMYGNSEGNTGSKGYAHSLILDSTCDISAAKSSTNVASQSTYTVSLANSGTNENMIYKNMSYDENELRWCCKETVFTYPESNVDPETDEWVDTGRYICYIELPIFMAENIQNDYHINISKMSWGDYRIVEKNPYYFILESQEDSFAFTFEVVAKLNDNQTLDNNAVIANDSIITENEETNQG